MRTSGVGFIAAGALSAALATPQQPVFRSGVELVRVDVLVVRDGRPVTGLAADDFEVFDNDVRQEIDRLHFEEVPIDVLLVLDNSRSVAGEKLGYLVEAGRAFLDGLRPGDRAGLVGFSSLVHLRADLTDDLGRVRDALETVEPSGSTSLFDALYVSVMLPGRPDARRLILLFSDGLDNTSWLKGTVTGVVRESDVVVYSVGIKRSDGVTERPNNELLESLAEDTGGRLFYADSSRRLRDVFVQVVQEMKARYLLTYYPQDVPREGWHTLRIRLTKGKGDIVARRGYFVPAR
jgi:VWFA-related protein